MFEILDANGIDIVQENLTLDMLPKIKKLMAGESVLDNIRVVASGDDLYYVRKAFTNIPNAACNEVTWGGDHARFIVDNLDALTLAIQIAKAEGVVLDSGIQSLAEDA